LYSTYRVIWENASSRTVIKDFKSLDPSSKARIINSTYIRFLNALNLFSEEKALRGKTKKEKLSIQESVSNFTIERLSRVMTFPFLKKNLQFMNNMKKQEDITIRVNDLSDKVASMDLIKEIQTDLDKEGIPSQIDAEISELLHVPYSTKSSILKNKWYQSGNLLFQDKASAAVISVLAPQPYETIYDMCAAPGIKTSLIAQHTKNRARIIAGEFFHLRTEMTRKLLNQLKVLNVHLITSDSIMPPIRNDCTFDRVLLDAPCSGSGTFLNNPELKLRQNAKFLSQNTTLQKKLFTQALEILKPNGILVYSTCSLYPEEGELQIMNFLDELEPIPLPVWFSHSYNINNSIIPGTGRLFPSIHHTQGFFIGNFKKKVNSFN
jgi:16S rRNA (cytosine967-C5)-methyltransferase